VERETAGNFSISAAVPVPEAVFEAVAELVPPEDRQTDGQVFAGFGADRFRTAIGRACKAAGASAFSPHDLRHRRATLWHLQGRACRGKAAGWLGHSPNEHLRTYAHAALIDRREIDHAHLVHQPVHTLTANTPISSHVQAPYGPSQLSLAPEFGLVACVRRARNGRDLRSP